MVASKRINQKVFLYSILLTIFILAIGIRIYRLDFLNLWRDEAYSVVTATHSLKEIIRLSGSDTMPPLFDLMLHLWINLFGSSETSVRMPSLLASLGTGVFTMLIFKKHLPKSNPITIALLFTVNIVSIFFAREARVYSLLTFFTTGALYFYMLIYKVEMSVRSRTIVFFYILFTTLSLYSHSLAIIPVFIQVLFLLIRSKQTNKPMRTFLKYWVPIFGIIVLLWSPWIITFISQAQRVGSDFWLTFSPINSPQETISGLVNGIRLFTQSKFTFAQSFFTFSLIGLSMWGTLKGIQKKHNFPLYIFLWGPLVFMFFVSFVRPILYVRYTSYLYPLLVLIISEAIVSIQTKYLRILVLLIIVFMNLTFYFNYIETPDSKPHYQEMISFVVENSSSKDVVLHKTALSYFPTKYYLEKEPSLTNLGSHNLIYDPANATPHFEGTALLGENDFVRDLTVLAKFDRLWLIELGDQTDRNDFLLGYSLRKSSTFDGNLHLELWEKNEKTCNCHADL